MKTKTKLWAVAIAGLLAVVGILVGIKAGQIGKMISAGESFSPPPEAVTSAKAEQSRWESTRSAIGTLVAVRGVTVGSELAGVIRAVGFDSGQSVKQGAMLVQLDTSTEEAQLAAAEAEAALARVNLERARKLRKAGSNAQSDLDATEARAKQAAAAVATLRATIAKKTIRAPFEGRLSIRQVELGQALAAGAAVATLQSTTPIHADFWLPQQALADVTKGQRVRMHVDIFPGAHWDGEVTTVNPEVDAASRNVRIRATFPNADGRLRPGMYVNLRVLSDDARQVLLIPATAVLFAPYGDSVFVIEEKKDPQGKPSAVARQKFVRLGERRGDFVAVASGLSPGDVVVSSGAFKLRNGAPVVVNDALKPDTQLAPEPADQ